MSANLDDVCIRCTAALSLSLSLYAPLPPTLSLSSPSKVRDNGTVFPGPGSERAEKKVTMATARVLFSRAQRWPSRVPDTRVWGGGGGGTDRCHYLHPPGSSSERRVCGNRFGISHAMAARGAAEVARRVITGSARRLMLPARIGLNNKTSGSVELSGRLLTLLLLLVSCLLSIFDFQASLISRCIGGPNAGTCVAVSGL